MSLQVDGVWKGKVWASTVWAANVWREGSYVTATEAPFSGAGSKKKKIRGPYSDPAIYEAYVQRCIAERNAPRDPVAAVLKENLIEAVAERRESVFPDRPMLVNEMSVLVRLQAVETAKRGLAAIRARIAVIEKQLKAIKEEEEELEDVLIITAMEL